MRPKKKPKVSTVSWMKAMIDFNTSQLTWLVVGSISIGGAGYLNMNDKVDELDKKLAVQINNTEHVNKSLGDLHTQLIRIEEKLDKKSK